VQLTAARMCLIGHRTSATETVSASGQGARARCVHRLRQVSTKIMATIQMKEILETLFLVTGYKVYTLWRKFQTGSGKV
jgi:hypothetical protein